MTQPLKIQIKLLSENAKLPIYSTFGSAGCDFFAQEDFTIEPTKVTAEMPDEVQERLASSIASCFVSLIHDKEDVYDVANSLAEDIKFAIEDTKYNFQLGHKSTPSGIAFGIPVNSNIELEIRSKSGLAFKLNVHAFNGTLDEDYKQELSILLYNLTSEPVHFKKGEKVAQGVFKQIIQPNWDVVDELNPEEFSSIGRNQNNAILTNQRTGGYGSTGKTQEGDTFI